MPTGTKESLANPGEVQPPLTGPTSAMDRQNGAIFFIAYMLLYLAAPVLYVDIVQAALCDKLGASATIANLPASAFALASFVPIFFAWIIPPRLERSVVVAANAASAFFAATVCLVLLLPVGNTVRLAAVIGQGLMQGLCGSISWVYMYQCLGRGTTAAGRVRALKLTFTFTPLAAIVGSLGSQLVLNRNFPFQNYLWNFALLYFVAVPCMAGGALACSRFELLPITEEKRQGFVRYMGDTLKSCVSVRSLVLLWVAYLLFNCNMMAMPNLSLYARHVMGRDPKDFAGLMMALRFGFKCVGGYALGRIALRWGERAPLTVALLFAGGAILWAWVTPGYAYLLAFGFVGVGELAGAYFPNYVVAISPAAQGARNVSILALVMPLVSLSSILYGALADKFGFPGSFIFAALTAMLALYLVSQLAAHPSVGKS